MPDSRKTPRNCPVNALAVSAIKIGVDVKIGAVVLDVDGKENRPGIVVLTCTFLVELPGIEPVSGCWSLSRTGTELRNDIAHDSPELTSVDPECAQNVPTQSHD
jgi:hypothetical protein